MIAQNIIIGYLINIIRQSAFFIIENINVNLRNRTAEYNTNDEFGGLHVHTSTGGDCVMV